MNPKSKTMLEVQIEHFVATMKQCGGNKVKTAESLGIALKSVYNWVDRIAGMKPGARPKRIKEIRCKDRKHRRRSAETAAETK